MITPNQCWLKGICKDQCPNTFCLKEFKLDYLYKAACITEQQRKHITLFLDADNSDKAAFKTLSNIEANIVNFIGEGNNLFIHSYGCGNGKTSWSLRLVESYFNTIWYKSDLVCKALFISVPRLLLALKDNISENNDYARYIKDNVYKADIVIWDDIATKATTVFESEHLFTMIDTRLNAGKSNIYTCNLSSEDLAEKLGDRLYSRIANSSIDIQFVGKDKRGLKA